MLTTNITSLKNKRSEEVNEVLSNMPAWMTKWGVIVIIFLIGAFVGAGYFVKLPDFIGGEVILTTKVPPASIISRSNGKVVLMVKDGQFVKSGERLGLIQNTANTDDMFGLIDKLEVIEDKLLDSYDLNLKQFDYVENLNLGEVQNAYQRYCKAVRVYQSFQENDLYRKQKAEIESEIAYTKKIISYLEKYAFKQQQYKEKSSKVLDPVFGESEKVEGAVDYSEINLEKVTSDNKINMIQYKMRVSQLNSKLAEIDFEEGLKLQQLRIELEESFKILKNQINMWENRYLLVTPFDGTVSFYKIWNDYQFVTAGEEVMAVLPQNNNILGKMIVPAMGAGKVKVGQPVMIKLFDYPHDEYGILEGKVQSISKQSREKKYVIDVKIENDLLTSYGKKIEFKQEMGGRAKVIVKDLRLYERLFKDLMKF